MSGSSSSGFILLLILCGIGYWAVRAKVRSFKTMIRVARGVSSGGIAGGLSALMPGMAEAASRAPVPAPVDASDSENGISRETGSGRRVMTNTGTVMGANRWSETHMSSRTEPNFQMIGSHFVSSSRTSVESRTVDRTSFFLVQDDGLETQIELADQKLAVREGQRVTAVYVTKMGASVKDDHWLCGLYNHSTGMFHPINQHMTELRGSLRLRVGALGVGAGTLYGMVSDANEGFGMGIFAMIASFVVIGLRNNFVIEPKIYQLAQDACEVTLLRASGLRPATA